MRFLLVGLILTLITNIGCADRMLEALASGTANGAPQECNAIAASHVAKATAYCANLCLDVDCMVACLDTKQDEIKRGIYVR